MSSADGEEDTEQYAIGIDEAGRGPVLGPMVYGACFCPCNKLAQLAKMGFADSKTLTDEKRQSLFIAIKNSDFIGWEVDVISPQVLSGKMKVRVISRNRAEYTRERSSDLRKVHKNPDPALHPFERAREYTRALNAVKLDKVFAKPFLAALSGHVDGVLCMSKHPNSLSHFISGGSCGEVRIWNLINRTCLGQFQAHSGFVRGVTVSHDGTSFFTCGDDSSVRRWLLNADDENSFDFSNPIPADEFLGKHPFFAIDHQRLKPVFATAGSVVEVWDHHRSEPVNTIEWGSDSVQTVKFNPVEINTFASAISDRSICLYDLKGGCAIKKLYLSMKSNAISWNPMEAFNFTVANEDSNLYSFDMRKLDIATNVHKDHVGAVMDLDYSPTGREFVSGSYDRTIRIFRHNEPKSREVYHTKRMQRVFCAKFTADASFVLSGSDDGNIRMWKANASAPLRPVLPREAEKLKYQEKLKERYQHAPEIKRIARHRHVPKVIYKAQRERRIVQQAARRRTENIRRHSKPGTQAFVAERKKRIVTVME